MDLIRNEVNQQQLQDKHKETETGITSYLLPTIKSSRTGPAIQSWIVLFVKVMTQAVTWWVEFRLQKSLHE